IRKLMYIPIIFFFSSRRRHTRWPRDWSSDVCSSDLLHTLREHDEGDHEEYEAERDQRRQVEIADRLGELVRQRRRDRGSRLQDRSEERRVGKEWRSRWWTDH